MCTLEKRGSIFLLTLTGDGEHRLNPTLIAAISSALRRVRSETTTSSALITTAHGKFFSNGYDLAWAKQSSDPKSQSYRAKLMSSNLRQLVADLISLPMPTIAAVTGHASAAGFILALSHDYVLMREDRGFLYMSELDIDLIIPPWFIAIVKCKIGAPTARREAVMRAAKLTATEAVKWGIIDSAHGSAEATVSAAVKVAEELVARKFDGDVYGQTRINLFSEVLNAIALKDSEDVNKNLAKL